MEPGIKPSSPSQISLWPLALLGTLLFALLSSKRNQSGESVHPQDSTSNKDGEAKTHAPLTANVIPTPPNSSSPNGGKHKTPLWEKLAVLVAVGLLLVNICQMRATQKAANTADQTMKLAYRPRLTLLAITPIVSNVNGNVTAVLDNGKLKVGIDLPNTGPFAAKNVRFFRFDHVSPHEQAAKFTYEELSGEPKVIPPKVESYNSNLIIVGTRNLSESELAQIQKGPLWATFSILVLYDDDFGTTHHTEFCGLYTLQNSPEICPWPVQND